MRSTFIGLVLVLALGTSAVAQPANQKVADEIIAMVKASWVAEAAKKGPESMKFFADDYPEFNGEISTRLDGKALALRLGGAPLKASGNTIAPGMAHHKV